jgi:hypothetical protein
MNRLKEELINRRDILFDNYLELDEKISRLEAQKGWGMY